MGRAVIAAAVAGLALSGCATTKPVEAPSNFAWTYSTNPGEGAKLAFGRPQSDEVVLMMVCNGASQVMLSAAGMNGAKLMLASGDTRTSVDGVVGEGFAGAEGLIEASVSTRAPALDAFRRSGDLNLTSGGRTVSLAATDSDRPAVERFFNTCAA